MNALEATFYGTAAIAIVSTLKTITEVRPVRALLYLIVSLLATAIVFYLLGAPFAAALEVITYAGAIMVLFVFVMMMLNLGPTSSKQERDWLGPRAWLGPSALAILLLIGIAVAVLSRTSVLLPEAGIATTPREVGAALFGPYALVTELASFLLLAGLVGAYHVGYRRSGQTRAASRTKIARLPR